MNIPIELYVFVIWLLIACTLEGHAWYIKKYKRTQWNMRQHGLLSFSNRQLMAMRWFWPISLTVFLLVVGLAHIISVLAYIDKKIR